MQLFNLPLPGERKIDKRDTGYVLRQWDGGKWVSLAIAQRNKKGWAITDLPKDRVTAKCESQDDALNVLWFGSGPHHPLCECEKCLGGQ